MMQPPKDIEKYAPHYEENKLLTKLKRVFRRVGEKTAHSVLVLYYLLQSPSVSKNDKVKICGALGYFILPFDLMPDFIPMLGFTDDISALAWAIHSIWKNVTPEMEEQARQKLQLWIEK